MAITPDDDPTNEPLSVVAELAQRWSEEDPRPERLATISVKVPIAVARELDALVYTARMHDRRITKQQIVTAALVRFLRMS